MDEATEKCGKLTNTLLTLLRYASLQSQRTPPNLHFPVVTQPDRATLMDNISAISPNPDLRMVSLSEAEEQRRKKRELRQKRSGGIKAFETELRSRKQQLHRTVDIAEIDRRLEMKIKAMYTEEKMRQTKYHVQGHVEGESVWRGGEGEGRVKRMSQEIVGQAVEVSKRVWVWKRDGEG